MYTIIQGVPVFADPTLSLEDIRNVAMDLIQSWAWEGRALGKIELISDKNRIHACTYEKASGTLIPFENNNNEE
jgi:hypothetical protein